MILLAGIRTEPPLALAAAALQRRGIPVRWFDQRQALDTELQVCIKGGRVHGELTQCGLSLDLDDVRGAYVRTMDDRLLPEVERLDPEDPGRARSRAVHDQLHLWLELTPASVVNRASSQASNGSKPYQGQLIRAAGFDIPETLVTSDPTAVLDLRRRHGRVIFKSISAHRSVVRVLTDLNLVRLERIRACPVMFQEYVEGVDVRVHTIGTSVAYAVAVHAAGATDYRYPSESGAPAPVLVPYRLDDDLAERCLQLASRLGLLLAGIDLRLRPDGSAVCFEVNPSPAYSYYELGAGVPISDALAALLAAS